MGEESSGVRARLRRTRAGRWTLKAIVFVLGAAFIALGLLLVVLPGPLTIPPLLLGLYLWSTEFAWAERLRDRALAAAKETWAAARRRPIRTGAITVFGLLVLGAGVYGAGQLDLVGRVQDTLG